MLLEKIGYKWPDIDICAMKLVLGNYRFLVYMYYTHPGYQTSIFGKNCVNYIQMFTVLFLCIQHSWNGVRCSTICCCIVLSL